MTPEVKEQVRRAANEAMEYYPNSHLGDLTRRQDLHSAFRSMRNAIKSGMDIWRDGVTGALDCVSGQRLKDMQRI